MRYFLLFSLAYILSLTEVNSQVEMPWDKRYNRAKELSQRFIIVDGHVDLPYRLRILNFRFDRDYIGIPVSSGEGDFDFERARAGGLDAPFMSVYIPSHYQKYTDFGKSLADTLINMVTRIAQEYPENFRVARSPEDVRQCHRDGMVALPMGLENGSPIGKDLSNVKYFKEKGISYITLTHSKDNHICDSSYDTLNTWGELSPFGREVIAEMNKVGIMVDVSHISDKAFYQVLALSKVPVIASHSSVRAFTPGFQRNMSDKMIKLLAEKGGVIMINFGSGFLDNKIRREASYHRTRLDSILNVQHLGWKDEKAQKIIREYALKNEALWADLNLVIDHIMHVVELVGAEHVGFGSDFDGVGDSLPENLKDVSDYPNLIYGLMERGLSESDIEKICSGNLFRVWREVLEYGK